MTWNIIWAPRLGNIELEGVVQIRLIKKMGRRERRRILYDTFGGEDENARKTQVE